VAEAQSRVRVRLEDDTKSGFDSILRQVRGLDGAFTGLRSTLAGLGVTIGAGAFALMIGGAIQAQAALDDLADTTSLTVETLSRLQTTARIGSHSFDMVTSTASRFAKNVAEAAGGNKELIRTFEALGISQERLRSEKFDDLFVEFAKKVGNASNQTYAIAYATELAGKSAAQALPFFRDLGEEGLKEARVSAEQAAAAEKLTKEWGRLKDAGDKLKNEIATGVVPWLTKMLEQMNEGIRIGGGFFGALNAGFVNPFRSPGENVAAYSRDLDDAKRRKAAFQAAGSNDLARLVDSEIETLSGRLAFSQFQQRQLALELPGAGVPDVNTRRAMTAGTLLPPPPAKGSPVADPSDALLDQYRKKLALDKESTELERLGIELQEAKYAKLTPQRKLELELLAKAIDLKNQEQRAEQLAHEEAERRIQTEDQRQAVMTSIHLQFSEQIKDLEAETRLMGLTSVERERAIALMRLEKQEREAIARLTDAEAGPEAYSRLRQQTQQAREAINARATAAAAQEQLEKTREEAKKLNEDLQNGLVNALFRGFEAGKGFAQNFRDALVNMFKTTVLTPVIKWIVSPLTGAATSVLGSLGIPGLGNSGGLGNILTPGGGIGGGLGGLSDAFSLGNVLTPGGGIGGGILGGAGAYGLATGAGTSQAALLAAQTGEFGAAGLAATAEAAGAGAAASGAISALPYVGWALAAYGVGKSLGLFGGKKTPAVLTGVDTSGIVSRAGGFTDQANFGNDRNQGYRWATHDHGSTPYFNQKIAALFDDMERLGEQLGLDTSKLDTARVPFSVSGYMPGGPIETAEILASNLGQVSDALSLELMPNLKEFAQANETATQTLVRMVQVQEQLRQREQAIEGSLAGVVQGLPGQLGITALEQYRDSLAVSDVHSPLDRFASARRLLDETYGRAMGGDLSAVGAFPGVLQSALGIGRDVYASGPQFQELFLDGNRKLNELLTRQQQVQESILRDVDMSIRQASQDQIAEIRQQTDALVEELRQVRGELRKIAQAA
jgi:hypothetical protein